MEKRIIELEKKSAYQERLIEDLNHATVELQERTQRLESALKRLQQQMATGGDLHKKPEDEVPPPHY